MNEASRLKALEEELLDLIVVEGQDSPASDKHCAEVGAPPGSSLKDVLMALLGRIAKEEFGTGDGYAQEKESRNLPTGSPPAS